MRSTRIRSSLALLAALALGATAPAIAQAQEQSADEKKPLSPVPVGERQVFAHYMVAYGQPLEFYKHEIMLAQRHGIDGFALNCGEWLGSRYVKSAENIYQAAEELGTDFKLFFSPDAAGLGGIARHMTDMVDRFKDHPNQLRHNGQVVLSSWAGNPSVYARAVPEVEEKTGLDICFVPYMFGPEYKYNMAWSPERALQLADRDYVDGLYNFGIDGTPNNVIQKNASARRITQFLGKIYMAGAGPTYNSANMRDMQGMKGYGAIWEGFIRDGADWVELVTWNDYNEDSNLNPYRWSFPRGKEKDYYVRDESYLDVTNYYSAWFKSDVQPKITQDKIYFTYRNRSKYQTKRWNPDFEQWEDVRSGRWPVDQIHDDARDRIYVTTFLTEPAQAVVTIGGKEHVFDQPAGIAHAWAPIEAGLPQFELRRDGNVLTSVVGRSQIIDEPTEADSRGGYHLINRTWTAGAVVGDALRIEAEDGELSGGAAKAQLPGGGAGVQTAETAGSGFTLKLPDGFETGVYNVRVTYSNPGNERARLTMTSKGAPHSEVEGYYIPMFFPPTPNGEPRTVSLFWTIYGNGEHLTLERQGVPARASGGPGVADYGQVTVDAIELVQVDPVEQPAVADHTVPEMVNIPGGEFEMGSADGEPDEQPVRTVQVDDFAIGKFEITNDQYEMFKPDHRRMRDGYSWRNREPVIYVSWKEAVQYCNWLSKQAGLTPAYELKEFSGQVKLPPRRNETEPRTSTRKWRDYVLVEGADGFRLPTEEQWEYVASGRGEGRTYPWGDQAPQPKVHGNFKGAQALEVDPVLLSQPALGTTVVGSFPEGASRDGIMDMAGNVSEWTSNRYIPTGGQGGAKHGPDLEAGVNEDRYRAMRGGSWGYYNHSQRVADREHNTAQYGGYIYIGLRVALPMEGYQKLQQAKE